MKTFLIKGPYYWSFNKYIMFSRSSLILWLFWNIFFHLLKGSELISDDLNINLTDYKSAGTDYENCGDNDNSIYDNDIHIYDQDIWNTDDEFDRNHKSDVSFIQAHAIDLISPVAPLVFEKNRTRAEREGLIHKKLHDIFKLQHPEVGYSLRNYYVENWPEGVDLFKDHWTKEEIDKINERLPILKFQLRDQYFTLSKQLGLDEKQCLTEAELDLSLTNAMVNKLLHERFKVESDLPNARKLDWQLLDKRCIPEKYHEVPLNSLTIQSPLIYQNREIIDNIHFYPAVSILPKSKKPSRSKLTRSVMERSEENLDSINEVRTKKIVNDQSSARDRSKQLKLELQELFNKQHPDQLYNLKKFRILNWPLEVNLFKSYWTKKEMNIIRRKMNEFKFVPMPITYEAEMENEFGVVLEKHWTKIIVFLFILDRFRLETGDPDAACVRWDLLDRSQIPSKYDRFEINHYTMRETRFFKNPEIVHNIHFKHSQKRKLEEIEQKNDKNEEPEEKREEIDLDEWYKVVFSDNEEGEWTEI